MNSYLTTRPRGDPGYASAPGDTQPTRRKTAMGKFLRFLSCASARLLAVSAHGDHDHSASLLDAQEKISDHDMEHIEENLGLDSSVKKSHQDKIFLYFKSADTDNDDRLDALEIMQTIIKFDMDDADMYGKVYTPKEDEEWVTVLDAAMKVQDLNDDGFISFAEFYSLRSKQKV